jgi:pilus assembly protein CpaB
MGRRTLLLIASILVAAIGTALIGLYVRGADSRARQTEGMVTALVAVRPIKAGTSMQDALNAIEPQNVQRKMAVNGYQGSDAKGRLSRDLKNRTVVLPIQEQQVITSSLFGGPGESATTDIVNERAVSVELTDPARAAGLLVPGSTVTIYLVPTPENGVKQKYRVPETGANKGLIILDPALRMPVILPAARVLGIGNQRIGASSNAAATSRKIISSQADNVARTIVTLDLSESDASKVISALPFGDLYFAVHKAS